jgi:hypothetical protein
VADVTTSYRPDSTVLAKFEDTKARRLARTSATFGDFGIVVGPPTGESPQASWDREMGNWQRTSINCITLGSQDSYTTGVKAFHTWCTFKNIDPTLQTVSRLYNPRTAPASFPVAAIACFLSWLAYERGLAPGSVRVYRSSVRFWLKTRHVDVGFFEHDTLGCLDAGLAIQWRARHEASETIKLPFTIEMWGVLDRYVCNRAIPMEHAALVAVTMGLLMLCRTSELLMGATDHFFRGRDVTFLLNDPGTGLPTVRVETHTAGQYPRAALAGVSCLIRSAKNDQEGTGHKCYFAVQAVSDTSAFCIATMMFEWAQKAQPKSDEPFLSYRGERSLSYNAYAKAIKTAAQRSGFDPTRFSPHSVRIGGASGLAAAGFDNYYIMKAGRWKSLAFLDYIRGAASAMAAAQAAISNPASYSNHDLRLLHPGAVGI